MKLYKAAAHAVLDITQYTWRLAAQYPHRLELRVHVAPEYGAALRDLLLGAGAPGRSKRGGVVVMGRPEAILAGLRLLGAGPGMVAAVERYVGAWAGAQRWRYAGLRRPAQEAAVRDVLAMQPAGPGPM